MKKINILEMKVLCAICLCAQEIPDFDNKYIIKAWTDNLFDFKGMDIKKLGIIVPDEVSEWFIKAILWV